LKKALGIDGSENQNLDYYANEAAEGVMSKKLTL